VILDLLDGQYKNSVRVVAFNTAEKWSQDVSADVAQDLRQRCDLQMRDVPFFLQDFVDCHEGRYRDVQLPLPMPGLNDRHRAKPQVRDSHYNSVRRCLSPDSHSRRTASTASTSAGKKATS